MTARVIVVGGVGIDEVLYVPQLPLTGQFVQATARDERVGGAALNVAAGTAAAGIATVLVGCIGTDLAGTLLADAASRCGVDSRLAVVNGLSARSVILVEPSGERAILGATDGLLDHIYPLPDLDVLPGDCLVVPSWRPSFAPFLRRFRTAGARVVVGLRALSDPGFSGADEAVGSVYELAGIEPRAHLDRVHRVVVTHGSAGAMSIDRDGTTTCPSTPAIVVDRTGAGDAFLAGWVVSLIRDLSVDERLREASLWGARAVATRASLPSYPTDGSAPSNDLALRDAQGLDGSD